MLSDNPDNRNISKPDDVKEHETNFSKSDNDYWPPGTVAVNEDSTVNGIIEK